MSERIRIANEGDVEEILNIYGYYINSTAITFEYEVPSLSEFKKRMEKVQKQFPWLVYEKDGAIIGYAYASLHKERAAYQWNVELSIYLSNNNTGNRVGTRLYESLLNIVTYQGYKNAYGCITLPNERSIALHKRFGFEEIGVFHNAGNKFNRWHDVIWLGKQLKEYEDIPEQPIQIGKLDEHIIKELIG
ncbi:phosphinothricin acetyltransferase [Mobilisporobacter senegalensis]|uniref:Phosphinothricin acetyltransferase n=1 Tax=Mobilisporobacter senegalensis TaxID=1329262 RepID=A0A3N1XYQ8_9FIRM|nr:GNAT family N-acetyltransferase [Mobilisporobacter senegalensis]ROR31709.1 phosphinothricin acetyltransferase [Mobilisporobacter senegalensis]